MVARPFFILICAFFAVSVFADSLRIPITDPGVAAQDLLDPQGHPIDSDEAAELAQSGVDLSTLDPRPNDAWNGKAVPAVDPAAEKFYPSEGSTLKFESFFAFSGRPFRTKVSANGTSYFLHIAVDAHTAVLTNALLRRLGYPIDSPKTYRELTVHFQDTKTRDNFVNKLVQSTLFENTRWVRTQDPKTTDLVLQDVVLEPSDVIVPNYHWGSMDSTRNPIKGRRAVRALLVPLTLAEVLESVNLTSWDYSKISDQSVILTYFNSKYFGGELTYADARWIALRIAKLNRADWKEIVKAGAFPEDISALLVEKLLSRRKAMMNIFSIPEPVLDPKFKMQPDTQITVGNVKNGKLTVAMYDGYAARFTYGDPDSPLRGPEIGRYLGLNLISAALTQGTSQLNTLLQAQTATDVAQQHQVDYMKQVTDWQHAHPGEMFVQRVEGWAGPIAGVNYTMNRNVVSGSYYGSDSDVQVVDNFGLQLSIGAFAGISGINYAIPSGTATVQIARNYTHVRPVTDMKEAYKADWTSVVVPVYIAKLASILDPENPNVDAELDDFLKQLKTGEMIVISDTIVAGANINVEIPVGMLLSMGAVGAKMQMGIGGGVTGTILTRTTFVKTDEGVQVYIQNAKTSTEQLQLDFSWYVSLIKDIQKWKQGSGQTEAYLFDKMPTDLDVKKKLIADLKLVLLGQNRTALENDFHSMKLLHDLKMKSGNFNALVWNWYRQEETHLLTIEPPYDKENGITNPADYQRQFVSDTLTRINGFNPIGFFNSAVNAAYPVGIDIGGNSGVNPANAFLGQAHWISVTTDAEITKDTHKNPVTTIEEHLGGWIIKKKGFFKLLDKLQKTIQSMPRELPALQGQSLYNPDEFANTKGLQLYDVSSQMMIYQTGIDEILKTVNVNQDLETVYNRLIEIDGGRPEFEKFCRTKLRKVKVRHIQNKARAFFRDIVDYEEKEGDSYTALSCTKSWMRKLLRSRKNFPSDPIEKTKWVNHLVETLHREIPLDRLMTWVGQDRFFFNIRVQGFRTHDERALNENSQTSYFTNSIGTQAPTEGQGVFDEFTKKDAKFHLFAHELHGRYLSEGF